MNKENLSNAELWNMVETGEIKDWDAFNSVNGWDGIVFVKDKFVDVDAINGQNLASYPAFKKGDRWVYEGNWEEQWEEKHAKSKEGKGGEFSSIEESDGNTLLNELKNKINLKPNEQKAIADFVAGKENLLKEIPLPNIRIDNLKPYDYSKLFDKKSQ